MHWKKILFNKKSVWILLGLLTIIFSSVLPAGFVEQFYSRGLFLGIRWMFTGLNSWLPFASVYLLFFILLGWLGFIFVNSLRTRQPWPKKILTGFHSLLAFAGAVIFFFQMLWGFNYGREPLEKTLGISPNPLTAEELRSELWAATKEVAQFRFKLPGDIPGSGDSVVSAALVPPDLENTMRNELTKFLNDWGYPTPGKVRGRLLWPKGLLLRISTAGVYIPFTGEGNIDPGLHYLQLPFVMVHEMSHAYGFGDEGTCNFLAYLACTQSDDPFLQYVGHLYYWRYVAADFKAFYPEEFQELFETLPTGMKADLAAIRREMEKYPDILPSVRDAAYTAYLQAQGIHEGLKYYDRVIMLVYAMRKKMGMSE